MGVTADIPLRALHTQLDKRVARLTLNVSQLSQTVEISGLPIVFVNTVEEMLDLTTNYALVVCTNYENTDGIISLWVRVPRDGFADNTSDIRASNVVGDVSYLRVYVRENLGVDAPEVPDSVDYIEFSKPSGGYVRYAYEAGAVLPTISAGDGTNAYAAIDWVKPDGTWLRWSADDSNVINPTAGDGTADTFSSITFNRGGDTGDLLRISFGNDNMIILEDL